MNGVRLERGGELRPWSEFCEIYDHYFRPDGTCVCGKKRTERATVWNVDLKPAPNRQARKGPLLRGGRVPQPGD